MVWKKSEVRLGGGGESGGMRSVRALVAEVMPVAAGDAVLPGSMRFSASFAGGETAAGVIRESFLMSCLVFCACVRFWWSCALCWAIRRSVQR